MNNNTLLARILSGTARTLLGLVFVFSGVVKAIDPLGTVYKIEDYLKAFGGFFTDLMPLAWVAAVALILTECILGALLLANAWTRVTSWITLAFYAVMTSLTLWIALTNPVSDCGCFGDALVLSNWQTFYKNIVLITLAILLLIFQGRKANVRPLFTVPQKHTGEFIALGAGIVIALLPMAYSQISLPVLDFRPYKLGANIPELMEIPEDAEPDVYETTLYYEKDGRVEEFTLANYPKGDSTWTFVDQKSRLVKKGYEAPIHDFEIINADYEDLTYDILESDDPVTLCIMYDLSKSGSLFGGKSPKAHRNLIDDIVDLKNASEIFYVLTGSGEQDIRDFGFPEDIEVCTCDPVTLKTIVRANPGIVVVQGGTIIAKYRL